MTFLPLLVLLAAPPTEPLKILVLDIRGDGVPAELARSLTAEVVVDLSREARFEVLSAEDMRRVVALEGEKSSVGCSADDCLAQLASAMGARFVVYGDVGLVGDTTVVHLSLFDTKTERGVARETADAATQNELLGSMRGAIGRIRNRITPPAPAPAAAPSLSTSTWVGVGVAGLGALGLIGGLIGAGVAYPTVVDLNRAPVERSDAQGLGSASTVIALSGVVVAVAGGGIAAWGLTQ